MIAIAGVVIALMDDQGRNNTKWTASTFARLHDHRCAARALSKGSTVALAPALRLTKSGNVLSGE